MSKKLLVLLTAVLLLTPFIFASGIHAETLPFEGHKIVLDAGHGGDDPGSTECVLFEKDATWDIASKLKTELEKNGAEVFMTRDQDGDTYDDLAGGGKYDNEARYTYANSTGAEILVSIHLNGSTDHSVNGTMNFYSKPRKDKEFATVMHTGMASYLENLVSWGVPDLRLTNFMSGVILKFNGPAVLTEPVFISNTNECTALQAGTRQWDIVNVLYGGISRWFGGDYEPLVIGKK